MFQSVIVAVVNVGKYRDKGERRAFCRNSSQSFVELLLSVREHESSRTSEILIGSPKAGAGAVQSSFEPTSGCCLLKAKSVSRGLSSLVDVVRLPTNVNVDAVASRSLLIFFKTPTTQTLVALVLNSFMLQHRIFLPYNVRLLSLTKPDHLCHLQQ